MRKYIVKKIMILLILNGVKFDFIFDIYRYFVCEVDRMYKCIFSLT